MALQTAIRKVRDIEKISQIVFVTASESFTTLVTEKVPATLHKLGRSKNVVAIKENVEAWQELFKTIEAFKERGIQVVFHVDIDPNTKIEAARLLAMLPFKDRASGSMEDDDDGTSTVVGNARSDRGEQSGMELNIDPALNDRYPVFQLEERDYLDDLQDDNWADKNFPDWRQDFEGDFEFMKSSFPELNKAGRI